MLRRISKHILPNLVLSHVALFSSLCFLSAPIKGAEVTNNRGRGFSAANNPSAQAILHGEKQLAQMLRERQQMAGLVKKDDPVWKWTVRQFAGEATHFLVFWSNDAPECSPDQIGESECPSDSTKPGLIRMHEFDRDARKYSGEQLWSTAIFELLNIRQAKEFNRVTHLAFAGKLTRAEYIREMAHLEFFTEQRLKFIYHTLWIRNIQRNKLVSDKRYWDGLDRPNTFEKWFANFTDKSDYPFSVYGPYYDKKISPVQQWDSYAPRLRDVLSKQE